MDLALGLPELAVPDVTSTLANVEGRSPEGTEIGVILGASDGMRRELEFYARDGRVLITIPRGRELNEYR